MNKSDLKYIENLIEQIYARILKSDQENEKKAHVLKDEEHVLYGDKDSVQHFQDLLNKTQIRRNTID